jgi:glutamate N-acetyltransferase / amino-acid N-acetyltransferase
MVSNGSMATLLSSVFTDAPIAPPLLQRILSYAVERSFNAISVDGDMSTNDTLAIFANGAASIPEIKGGKALDQFQDMVTEFAEELAKLVVWDGEGATKFVTITVKVSHTKNLLNVGCNQIFRCQANSLDNCSVGSR